MPTDDRDFMVIGIEDFNYLHSVVCVRTNLGYLYYSNTNTANSANMMDDTAKKNENTA